MFKHAARASVTGRVRLAAFFAMRLGSTRPVGGSTVTTVTYPRVYTQHSRTVPLACSFVLQPGKSFPNGFGVSWKAMQGMPMAVPPIKGWIWGSIKPAH